MKRIITIDSSVIKQVLDIAARRLRGEWILIGGTVLPALGIDYRDTMDIDLIAKGKTSTDDALKLMEIAEEIGLPVETINQAGAFFLRKIPLDESDLIPLRETKTTKIFRPTLKLYIKLKLSRLSESDLSDCIAYAEYCAANDEPIPIHDIGVMIKSELKKEGISPERESKLLDLDSSILRIAKVKNRRRL